MHFTSAGASGENLSQSDQTEKGFSGHADTRPWRCKILEKGKPLGTRHCFNGGIGRRSVRFSPFNFIKGNTWSGLQISDLLFSRYFLTKKNRVQEGLAQK